MSADDLSEPWVELSDVCRLVHRLTYVDKRLNEAKTYVPEIRALLDQLPSDTEGIIYWEGAALVAELNGCDEEAIAFRRREIELTAKLHKLVADGIDHPRILNTRDDVYLADRKAILATLVERVGRAPDPP